MQPWHNAETWWCVCVAGGLCCSPTAAPKHSSCDCTHRFSPVPRWRGRGAGRAPGAVAAKAALGLRGLVEDTCFPGLPRARLASDEWDGDEERRTAPLRRNWQRKSSVFKFSADEEGKNSLQHLVYITALCFGGGRVYSEALGCVARGVLELVVLGGP